MPGSSKFEEPSFPLTMVEGKEAGMRLSVPEHAATVARAAGEFVTSERLGSFLQDCGLVSKAKNPRKEAKNTGANDQKPKTATMSSRKPPSQSEAAWDQAFHEDLVPLIRKVDANSTPKWSSPRFVTLEHGGGERVVTTRVPLVTTRGPLVTARGPLVTSDHRVHRHKGRNAYLMVDKHQARLRATPVFYVCWGNASGTGTECSHNTPQTAIHLGTVGPVQTSALVGRRFDPEDDYWWADFHDMCQTVFESKAAMNKEVAKNAIRVMADICSGGGGFEIRKISKEIGRASCRERV
jgi:hypothetical protein